MKFQLDDSIAIDVNTGAESMEHRMFVRRGEMSSIQSSITRVVRAGNDGRWMGGGISSAEVSERSVTIVSARSESPQKLHTTEL